MRVVFLNSLEKREGDRDVAYTAQVWIAEENGAWRLGWNEITPEEEQENIWYEGVSWSEMLHIYRHRLVMKMSEGYIPMIDGIWEERESLQGRGMMAQKLVCYSEMNPNESLYLELCSWRRKRAAQERKAPYLIASNRLLKMISVFCPKTIEELLQLPGVGNNKAQEYGSELLLLMENVERESTFPLDWVNHELDEESFRTWIYKQKEMKFRAEMERFNLRRSVLECLAEQVSVEEISTRTGIERREVMGVLEELAKAGYSVDYLIESELEAMAVEERDHVWRAYDELGHHLLKPVLQRVYGQEAANGSNAEKLYEQLRLIRISYRNQNSSVRNAG
jgi:hypothetical protein